MTAYIDMSVPQIESELEALFARAEGFVAKADAGDMALSDGVALIKELNAVKYLGGDKRFENRPDLFRAARRHMVRVFKRCIPGEAAGLRDLTELLVGSKPGSFG